MYHAASKPILDLSRCQLDVIPGFSLILHTWSQTLIFHPHLHCILVGGAISLDQKQFKSFKKKYFLPIKMLSHVYRAKLVEDMKSLYHNGELVFPKQHKNT